MIHQELHPLLSIRIPTLRFNYFFWKWLVLHYIMPINRIKEQKVSTYLPFLHFKLLLGFGLNFEVGLELMLGIDLGLG